MYTNTNTVFESNLMFSLIHGEYTSYINVLSTSKFTHYRDTSDTNYLILLSLPFCDLEE